jgi:transcriptional regulator with XRE-family HTH domain
MGTTLCIERASVFFVAQPGGWERPTVRCSECGRTQFINPKRQTCVACHSILLIIPIGNEDEQDASRREIADQSEGFGRRIAIRLRDIRKLRGMTQPELAKAVPCVRTYISKYERGFCVPTLPIISKIAAALGIEMRQLLDENIDTEALAAGAMTEGLGLVCDLMPFLPQLDMTSRYVILQAARGLATRGQLPPRLMRKTA